MNAHLARNEKVGPFVHPPLSYFGSRLIRSQAPYYCACATTKARDQSAVSSRLACLSSLSLQRRIFLGCRRRTWIF
jgi:hypothetical protein